GVQGDPGIMPKKDYVQALLTANMGNYRKVKEPTAAAVESAITHNPSANWRPVVFPDLEPTYAQYTSADVWTADGKVVACATLKLDGKDVALMASPWTAGDPIPGAAALKADKVDKYAVWMTHNDKRGLIMWENTFGTQTVLYSLLVLSPMTDEELKAMALNLNLEIMYRADELANEVPG
ncbi:MAG: hypothetical protein ABI743_06090, partial [bacterium]